MAKQRRVRLGIPTADMHGGLHQCFIDEKAHGRLRKAFVDVIHLLCERSKGFVHNHDKQLFPVSFALQNVGAFEPGIPDKLRELWGAIDEAISDARQKGEEDGASLLKQLAAGKATIDDYNQATIGK